MSSYRINGEDVEADEQTEGYWQDLRDALGSLSNAYGVDYDVLLNAAEEAICESIGDARTAAQRSQAAYVNNKGETVSYRD